MKFGHALLSVTPETLKAIDLHLTGGETHSMITPAEVGNHRTQCIIASEFIGIDNRASSDRFDGHIQEALGRNIPDHSTLTIPLRSRVPKKSVFPAAPRPRFPLRFPPKLGFIQFDLASYKKIRIQLGRNRKPQDSHRLEHGRITQPDLLSNSSGGELHFKEFDDPQPFLKWNSKSINPSTGVFGRYDDDSLLLGPCLQQHFPKARQDTEQRRADADED